jgi:hypothetical protein
LAKEQSVFLLNRLGQLLADERGDPSDGILLHAAVDSSWISIAIFKNRGSDVLYVEPDYDLFQDTLYDLWALEEGGKRWEELDYLIKGERFDAAFIYPEEIDREELSVERSKRLVKSRFGDKPIVYPPWPSDLGQPFEL